MIDDLVNLLIDLAENADPTIVAQALDRHHIDDPGLRSALLNKDSQALMRLLGPEAPLPNNSSVYAPSGSADWNLSQDGDETKFTLTNQSDIFLTYKKPEDAQQYQEYDKYQVLSGILVAQRAAPDDAD